MNHLRLVYFQLRGRAEAIRLLLHSLSMEFDDHRVESSEEWTSLKPLLPFGSLPVLESNGSRIAQSHAILRHLGRTLTSVARDESVLRQLDEVQEFVSESQEDLWRFNWSQNYYELLQGYAENTLQARLVRLSNCLSRSGKECSSHWFGPSFSYVDCATFCFLDEVDAFFPSQLSGFPDLTDFHARVASLPKLASYMASGMRPVVFGIGSMGPKVDPRLTFESGATFSSPWADPIDLETAVARQRRF